jgi:integrase
VRACCELLRTPFGRSSLFKKRPFSFQTIRRSNATFLVVLGVSPRVAMRWMGHSDVATTLKIYQQAPDELQERAAELMGELLFAPKSDE